MSFVFDPYAPDVHRDPFPYYRTLRDHYPVYRCEPGGFWILSRYGDITAAVLDTDTFSSAKGNIIDDSPQRAGATLGTTDPPRHDQLRKLVQSAFLNSNVAALEKPARRQAKRIVEDGVERGTLDLVTELATPVTTGILSDLLGLPSDNLSQVKSWVSDSLRRDPISRESPPEANEARAALTELTESVIAERTAAPRDDLISGLISARIESEALSTREVLMTTRTLLAAGVESTVSFFGNLALNLMTFDDARRQLVMNPSLIPDAIEESLRFNTSAQRFSRTLTRPLTLHGCRMEAADKVMVLYGSANRDDRMFHRPDLYDIERRPTQHVGFGHGKHYCIGAGFARLLTRILCEELLSGAPAYSLAAERLEWLPSPAFRSVVRYPVVFEASDN